MAQFPMGGFFNRPQQHNPHFGQFPQRPGHGMMGNMQRPGPGPGPMQQMPMGMPRFGPTNPGHPPQQHAPRGTFPPQMGTNMPQMGAPAQQMPPMHLLNPTNDPNVRFEPIPGGMMPPGANAEPMPQPTSPLVGAADIIIKLGNLTQGESNSIVFYENMASSARISEKDKELVAELLANKRRQIENVTGLYRNLTNSEWAAAKDMKVEGTRDFRADITYALLQESRLLREASQIYADLGDPMHQRTMNTVLYNKVADIAHLMAL